MCAYLTLYMRAYLTLYMCAYLTLYNVCRLNPLCTYIGKGLGGREREEHQGTLELPPHHTVGGRASLE